MIALVVAWMLQHRRGVAWGAALALCIGAIGGVYLAGRHAQAVAEAPRLAAAEAQAATAQAESAVVTTAARAADHAAVRTVQVSAKAEEAVHEIQSAPGASDALSADLLARWRAGIDGVRGAPAPAPDRTGG